MTTPRSRRTRTLVLGAIPVVLLGGLLSVDKIPGTDIALTVPYAAEGPGPIVDTLSTVEDGDVEVVEVKAPEVDKPAGHLNMTTVSVRTNMTLLQVLGRWITTDDNIVPLSTVLPPDMSTEEVEEANLQAFTQSEAAATVTAMNYLKIPVKIVVAAVVKGGAADGALEPEDIITKIDGKAVNEPGEVQEAIQAKSPGDSVEVTYLRGDEEKTDTFTLGEHPHDKERALLGVSMTSTPVEDIEVKYNLQDIGGPSAGLLFSLAVIDKLSPGDLTGGANVAGTGTIGEDGKVGPIGGIVHKVEASKEKGVELFLAPSANCDEATSRDTGDMVVAKVDTIEDAVKAMEDYSAGRDVVTCQAG